MAFFGVLGGRPRRLAGALGFCDALAGLLGSGRGEGGGEAGTELAFLAGEALLRVLFTDSADDAVSE